MMKKIKEYTDLSCWQDHQFIISFLRAASFLALTLIINYYAVRIATANAGYAVNDLILNKIKIHDTRFIDYYAALYLQYLAFAVAMTQGRVIVFFLKTTALLILTRSLFVNLTYLGIPQGAIPTKSFFTQGGDLFFSGHVALPFLAALVFWDLKFIRYFFLGLSLLMAIEVLLGHQHYTIDVVSAPFITYGIYVISKKIFKDGGVVSSRHTSLEHT